MAYKKFKYFFNGYDDCPFCGVATTRENDSYTYGVCTTCNKMPGFNKFVKRIEHRLTELYKGKLNEKN